MEEWSLRWQVGQKYRLDDQRVDSTAFDSLPLVSLPTPSPQQIIDACLSFPAGTGLGGAAGVAPDSTRCLPLNALGIEYPLEALNYSSR